MAKDSPRTTAGELQKIENRVSGSENLKKKNTYITTCCSGHPKLVVHSSKNNLQHIQLSDTTGTSNGTGFYGQMKLKNELFSSKHSRWV